MLVKILRRFVIGVLLAASFLGYLKFQKFAQDLRESQKQNLAAAIGKQIPEAAQPVQEPETQVPQETPSEKTEWTYAQWLEEIQHSPPIETCAFFEGRGLDLFKKYTKNPKIFEILVLDQQLEIGLVAYRLPLNRALLAHLDENPSFFSDIKFTLDFKKAQKEVEDNIALAREIEMRGYYARVLAKALVKNPSLLGDSEVSSLCNKFADLNTATSQDEMKTQVFEFLKRAQVKPEEIDFDPNFKPTVEIVTSTDGNKVFFPKKKK